MPVSLPTDRFMGPIAHPSVTTSLQGRITVDTRSGLFIGTPMGSGDGHGRVVRLSAEQKTARLPQKQGRTRLEPV